MLNFHLRKIDLANAASKNENFATFFNMKNEIQQKNF